MAQIVAFLLKSHFCGLTLWRLILIHQTGRNVTRICNLVTDVRTLCSKETLLYWHPIERGGGVEWMRNSQNCTDQKDVNIKRNGGEALRIWKDVDFVGQNETKCSSSRRERDREKERKDKHNGERQEKGVGVVHLMNSFEWWRERWCHGWFNCFSLGEGFLSLRRTNVQICCRKRKCKDWNSLNLWSSLPDEWAFFDSSTVTAMLPRRSDDERKRSTSPLSSWRDLRRISRRISIFFVNHLLILCHVATHNFSLSFTLSFSLTWWALTNTRARRAAEQSA